LKSTARYACDFRANVERRTPKFGRFSSLSYVKFLRNLQTGSKNVSACSVPSLCEMTHGLWQLPDERNTRYGGNRRRYVSSVLTDAYFHLVQRLVGRKQHRLLFFVCIVTSNVQCTFLYNTDYFLAFIVSNNTQYTFFI
jgi:hypothetical protein